MNETAVLGTVVAGLWGLVLALVGVVWSTLKERNKSTEERCEKLESQNTLQETSIGRLTERLLAREEAHQSHREDMSSAIARLEASIAVLSTKLDRVLGAGTPYPRPGQYRQSPGDSGEKR
jgi:uncharacterized coiled-coil protein SlyX